MGRGRASGAELAVHAQPKGGEVADHRVRQLRPHPGHVSALPNYEKHGGPAFTLPAPRETFCAAGTPRRPQLVLASGAALADKEAKLVRDEQVLKQQWAELSGSRKEEQTTVRSARFHSELRDKRKALDSFPFHPPHVSSSKGCRTRCSTRRSSRPAVPWPHCRNSLTRRRTINNCIHPFPIPIYFCL